MTRLARLALLFSFAAGCAEPAFAQTNNAHGNIGSSQAQQEMSNALTNQNLFGAPRQLLVNFAVCSATLNLGGLRVDNTSNPGTLYFCNGSAWTAVSTGGGSVAFSSITGGTNTTAAMVLGTGSSLSSTGGTATFLDGANFKVVGTADNTKVLSWSPTAMSTGVTETFSLPATANSTFLLGATGTTSVVYGPSTVASSTGGVAVGSSATAGATADDTAVGASSSCTAGISTCVGFQATSAVANSEAYGAGSTATAQHQFVSGSTTAFGNYVTDVYFGSGVSDSTAQPVAYHATSATGTNAIGGAATLTAGASTGNADSALDYVDQGLFSVTTGTTAQTIAHHGGFGLYKTLTNNTVTSVLNMTDASNTVTGSIIKYSCLVFNGTDLQIEIGEASCSVQNKAGVFSGNACTKFGTQQPSPTSGTLAVTLTVTGANPAVVQVNCNSSLTPSAGYPIWGMDFSNMGNQAMTVVP